jgi:glycosyltransferase involved in cell wall biosynthesis
VRLAVCAITSGARTPSARFRVRQHIEPLHALGIDVHEHVPRVPQSMPMPGPLARVRRRWLGPVTGVWMAGHALSRVPALLAGRHADLVWLERSLAPGFDGLVRTLRRPLVYDIDDAVWLEGMAGRGAPTLARHAAAAIAGNQYLADWLSAYCPQVHVVPTAVDCARYAPRRAGGISSEGPARFVIGWTGTSGNFKYLENIAPALAVALREIDGATLRIVADRRPELPALHGLAIEFVRWSPATEVTALRDADVGLMPLADDAWTRGKCSYKMLQYMALGVPTVVSPVGMNRDVLGQGESGLAATTHDEWVDALRVLAHDQRLRDRLGATGRAVVQAHYDVPVVAAQLARVFQAVATGHGG